MDDVSDNRDRADLLGWPTVAVDFLVLFARTEGRLKQTGHLQAGQVRAVADWRAFAQSLGDVFFEVCLHSGCVRTLLGEPPRRRLKAGLRWVPERPEALKTVDQLFLNGVCQVRNNLAHGEKFAVTGDGWDRDLALVTEALWVLERAVEQSGLFAGGRQGAAMAGR